MDHLSNTIEYIVANQDKLIAEMGEVKYFEYLNLLIKVRKKDAE